MDASDPEPTSNNSLNLKQLWQNAVQYASEHKWTCFLCCIPSYFALRYLYIRARNYSLCLPPGPVGIPLFGTYFHQAFIYKSNWSKYIAMTYGPIALLPMTNRLNHVLISDSSIAKQILQRKDCLDRWDILAPSMAKKRSRATTTSRLEVFTADDNVTRPLSQISGDSWQRRRRLIQNSTVRLLTSHVVTKIMNDAFVDTLVPYLNELSASNGDKKWDVLPVARYIAFNTIFMGCFGFNRRIQMNDELSSTIMKDMEESVGWVKKDTLFRVLPVFKYLYSDTFRDFMAFRTKRNKLLCDLILNHQKQKPDESAANGRFIMDDIVDLIEKKELTLSEACMDLFFLFLAGVHTTSHTIEFGMVLIAKNMHNGIVDRVRNELRAEMKQKNQDGSIMLDLRKVNNCPLLRAFVHEIMRIASVVPFGAAHLCKKDIWVEDGRGNKYRIPKKTGIQYNIDYIQRVSGKEKATNWQAGNGDDVHLENWLITYPEQGDDKVYFKMNDAFLFFGSGRRDCVGKSIAIKELYAIIGFVMLNYDLSLKHVNENVDDIKLGRRTIRTSAGLSPKLTMSVRKLF